MYEAVMFAYVFGPYLLIMGLWMLFNHERVLKVVDSIKQNPGILNLIGVMYLLIGLFILTNYNVWEMNLAFLVTLYGWVQIIRGVWIFLAPKTMLQFHSKETLKWIGIIPLVVGFAMCWIAFFQQ